MEKLPTEIEENILCRLTTETALRAKQVCRTWRILLRSRTDKVGFLFNESYHDVGKMGKLYYSDQYDTIRGKISNNYFDERTEKMCKYIRLDNMLGSCNGLVCFQRKSDETSPGEPFLICNPITGEHVYVPEPDQSMARYGTPTRVSGFGYCHYTNEYKIVSMHYQSWPKNDHALVYTVGGGGEWRNKGSFDSHPVYSSAVYANGALHWLHQSNGGQPDEDYMITAFNLEDENFQFITLPRLEDVNENPCPRLLGGNTLSLVFTNEHSTDIWAYKRKNTNTTGGGDMKQNHDDKNSWHWIKDFRIEWEEPHSKNLRYFEPLVITRNGEVLWRHGYRILYCYDLKTSTLNKIFDSFRTDCNMITVIPHANSIVKVQL